MTFDGLGMRGGQGGLGRRPEPASPPAQFLAAPCVLSKSHSAAPTSLTQPLQVLVISAITD